MGRSRVRRSVRRLLQGASGGWRARLQRVDRLAPEKRVGCAGCPPLFPTTVSRSCPAPAIIFAELARPAPLGGLPHDSSCGECAGTTRRKEKKKQKMKEEQARGGAVAGGGLQRPPAPCPARGPPAPSAPAASSWRIAPWSTGRSALSSSAWSAVAGGQPPSAGKAGGLRRGSPTTVSRSRPSARNYFCGTRETGAAWWPSARLIVRRVRRDYKKEEEKKRTRREKASRAAHGAQPPGLQGAGLCAAPRTGCAACRAPSLGWRPPSRGRPHSTYHVPYLNRLSSCPVMQPPT